MRMRKTPVLFAHYDEGIREQFRDAAKAHGFTAVTATTAREAHELQQTSPKPRIAVVDWQLSTRAKPIAIHGAYDLRKAFEKDYEWPEDGITATGKMLDAHPSLKVVLFTASDEHEVATNRNFRGIAARHEGRISVLKNQPGALETLFKKRIPRLLAAKNASR